MKAIILSAGQGSRLGHLVDNVPKCLIDFNGRTLLDRQLDTLEANGVNEAVVVTGFHDELVNEALERRSGGPYVRTVYNPFYKVADNTGSLYMAREELSGDCLVWNGDTLVSNELMKRVVANDRSYMGEHTNGRVANALGTLYLIVILVAAIAALPLMVVTRAGQ